MVVIWMAMIMQELGISITQPVALGMTRTRAGHSCGDPANLIC